MELPADVQRVFDEWGRRGHFCTLAEGHRIFAVQEGSGPDVVLVHGFPSTSHDFAAALPEIVGLNRRVLTWDHLGFGFSDKPTDPAVSYSLLDQARRAGEIVAAHGVRRARVIGHDMGLTIAVEMLCLQHEGKLPFEIEALVMCNGSHLIELARLTPLQYALMTDEGAAEFARTYDPERFAQGFRFLWADPSRTPDVDIRAIAYWIPWNEGLQVIGRIARYNIERRTYAKRWREIFTRIKIPMRVVWGEFDPIAVPAIGEKLAEMARTHCWIMRNVGHYPQMEAPSDWVDLVMSN
ncbi:MAG: putative hydrolase LipZ [Candidatus Binatia bacterium]|nr:MAG: putative hydrolase LipZ [Candidatus Binatia bacterium]